MKIKQTKLGKIRIEISADEGFVNVHKNDIKIDLSIEKADMLCTELVKILGKEGRYHYHY